MGFDWESDEQKERYIKEGKYVKDAVVPIDVFIAGKEIFLGIPRATGVPAALVTLNMAKNEGGGPLLRPYPDWSWTDSECDKSIVSVYRVTSDKCGRLWVLDNGKIDEQQKCPPKVLAFDLKTRKLLLIKEIPKEYAFNKTGSGLLVTPLVETFGPNCEKVKMYIADIEGYGLIIWDGKDKFRRFDSEVFAAQKPNFTLNGDSFYLTDGLVGMALTKRCHNPELYFTALASTKLFHVPTKELDFTYGNTPNYVENTGDVDFRKVALVIDGDTMYFCSLEDNALMSWNIKTKFERNNMKTIAKSDKWMQFVSGMKLSETYNWKKCIYGISNKFQRSAAGNRNISEYNYHIFIQRIY
ncbi:hypothetical protein KPH14_005191 [Odynerus spinipes]|uniref:Uncharacterized protein n=1 Tax=Odynerus spinipes TaxID=1348599 RepID=A0AAD9VNR8_9HYME|nr:hypothetical protein KPH14_005191 [Odynerus spinipes]